MPLSPASFEVGGLEPLSEVLRGEDLVGELLGSCRPPWWMSKEQGHWQVRKAVSGNLAHQAILLPQCYPGRE